MIRLLFSSAGRRVELINCFRTAALDLKVELEIVAIDMEPAWSPACQVADYAYKVSRCTDPEFHDQVVGICKRHAINLVIPTIDTELIGFAEWREEFAQNGTEILVSSLEFVRVARDKEATARILNKYDIPVPRTWNLQDAISEPSKLRFPLLIKPRDGSCSKGICIVNTPEELQGKMSESDRYVAQDLCQGREYTINCFYDRSGRCVSCVPHYRKLVRDGEVCFAETVRVPEYKRYTDTIAEIFPGIWGTICYQGFQEDNGTVNLFEINARFGGGYPICDRAGGTFARWILQDLSGEEPDYHDNWQEGVRMLRYDAAIFTEGG